MSLSFSLCVNKLSCERDERILFEALSYEFSAGSITQIAGPNGVGKTTLMKIIIGIIAPASGDVQWRGSSDRNAQLREALLYLGHLPAVKTSLTARENLQWFFGLNGIKQSGGQASVPSEKALRDALFAVGMAGYDDALCYQMSAGQQRRVALARLYLSKAPLWLLDEPFTAIDAHGVSLLEECIRAHAEAGGIVLLTTHQSLSVAGIHILDLADFLPQDNVGAE